MSLDPRISPWPVVAIIENAPGAVQASRHGLDRRAAEFRLQYHDWIGVPAQEIYEEHRGATESFKKAPGKFR